MQLIILCHNCEILLSVSQVSPLESNVSESVCSLKFAQRVRSVEIGPSSSSRRQAENSSTSSSPTHDGVEVQRHKHTHPQVFMSENNNVFETFTHNFPSVTNAVVTMHSLFHFSSSPVHIYTVIYV